MQLIDHKRQYRQNEYWSIKIKVHWHLFFEILFVTFFNGACGELCNVKIDLMGIDYLSTYFIKNSSKKKKQKNNRNI